MAHKIFYVWLNLLSISRLWRLKISVWLHRGKLVFGSHIKIYHPVVFQGQGYLKIADDVILGFNLAGAIHEPIVLQPRTQTAVIEIGPNTSLMNGCEVIACHKVVIGANCLIGPRTIFMDSDFHGIAPTERRSAGISVPILVEDNVWIGTRCIILKGVRIKKDAVIAAGAIVVKDVNAGEIVAGSPARVVGSVYQKE